MFLLGAEDMPVAAYACAADFLAVAAEARGVLVTDVRMPEMDGMALMRRLAELNVTLPVIVMTGHGDIGLAVEAMKAGVADFIEKPYDEAAMVSAVRAAMARSDREGAAERERADYRRRLAGLSQRERDVLAGLVAGKANKVIAADLDISPRTIEIYRAKLMTKTEAGSLSELVRMHLATEGF